MAVARPWRNDGGILTLRVRVTPKGGRDALEGFACGADGRCHALVRVRALPEDGAANAGVLAVLAGALGVRKSAIDIVSGASSRLKTLRIEDAAGAAQTALEALWREQEG